MTLGLLTIDQDFPVFDDFTGFVGGTLSYLGDRYGNFSPSADIERIKIPSYSTIDLRIGLRRDDWSVTLFGKNLTDERGIIGASPEVASGATGVFLLNIIMPRTFGVSLVKEF